MTNKLPYPTTEVSVAAIDGTPVALVVPTELPSNERADQLVALYREHVRPIKPGDSWKCACSAIVSPDIADDVAEAMNHMGSIVDERKPIGNLVMIYSLGYWAHGF